MHFSYRQDYFTCENPFLLELESRLGKDDADLVRAFYQKPMFRGTATALPHDVQVEHERFFKSEVEQLLMPRAGALPLPGELNTNVGRPSVIGDLDSSFHDSVEMPLDTFVEKSALAVEKRTDGLAVTEVQRGVREEENDDACKVRAVQRLEKLFSTDGDDRTLPGMFASMVSRMGPGERELVAWTDHCACLPRHLATREEVSASVRRAEELLRLEIGITESRDWSGRPGVVTVARSAGDGYVPMDMVGFVEGEVLAMLKKLFGDGPGLEVLYEEGMEH